MSSEKKTNENTEGLIDDTDDRALSYWCSNSLKPATR
jgi:hypothetical protein